MKGQIITLDTFFCFLLVALMLGALYQLYFIYSNAEIKISNYYLVNTKMYEALKVLQNDVNRFACKLRDKRIYIYGCLSSSNHPSEEKAIGGGEGKIHFFVKAEGSPILYIRPSGGTSNPTFQIQYDYNAYFNNDIDWQNKNFSSNSNKVIVILKRG
jgi:hypothetical protein